jgi:hypothetical protein
VNKLKHIIVGSLAAWILWNYQETMVCSNQYDANSLVVCMDDRMRPIDETPWDYVEGFDFKRECVAAMLIKQSKTKETERKANLYIINKFRCWPAGYTPKWEDS